MRDDGRFGRRHLALCWIDLHNPFRSVAHVLLPDILVGRGLPVQFICLVADAYRNGKLLYSNGARNELFA